jgi:hypothetical protein
VTRSLFLEGRRISSDLLRAPVFTASVSLGAVAALFALVVLLARRKWAAGKPRALVDGILVAAGTTELLYLVFRQVFLVGLAPGLISW